MKTNTGKRSLSLQSAGPVGEDRAELFAGAAMAVFEPTALQGALQHLAAAAKKQWKCYRKELKRCQKRFSEREVHQFRVETRRLLSLVELHAPFLPTERADRIRDCLKRHLDTFDDLRDTHVQLLLTRKLADGFGEAAAFEAYLRKREKHVRRPTLKRLERVRTKRLGKWISSCRKELKKRLRASGHPARGSPRRGPLMSSGSAALLDPASPGARLLRSVDSAFERTLEMRSRIDPADTATIHGTRVAFKKFRYMVEVLSAFLPVASPGQLAAMHRYQTLMGDVQDTEILIRAFEKFARKRRLGKRIPTLTPDSGTGRPSFQDELSRRRHQLIERFLAQAGRLDAFWPPGCQKRKHAGQRPSAATTSHS